MAPTTTLSGIAAVKLKPLKNLRPIGPSTLKPAGLVFPYYTTNFPTKKEAAKAASFLICYFWSAR